MKGQRSVSVFLTFLAVAAVQARLLAPADTTPEQPDAIEVAAEESFASSSATASAVAATTPQAPGTLHPPSKNNDNNSNSQTMMTRTHHAMMSGAQQNNQMQSQTNDGTLKMHLNRPGMGGGTKKKHHFQKVKDVRTKSTKPTNHSGNKNNNNNNKSSENNRTGDGPDCGAFLIEQSSSLVFYDKYQEIDLAQDEDSTDMVCEEFSKEEFCFGTGNGTIALYVQGECNRGVGTTQVSFAMLPTEAPSFLLFACRGSTRAKPAVKCECTFLDDERQNQDCDYTTALPFRAEAHFGNLTMDTGVNAMCTLVCKMPTTDE